MAEGNEFFTPYQNRLEEPPLESRLRNMEAAIGRLRDFKRGIVHPVTGEVVSDDGGSLGGGSGGGDGGGGGGSAVTAHEILNNAYHNDAETNTPVSQDILVANASLRFDRKAVGSEGFSLQVISGLVAWATRAHNLLSSIHGDTSAAACARGAVIVGNAAAAWARVLVGASGTYLGSDGTDTAFRQVQHSELGGVTANQHHNQSHVLATGTALGPDHTISGAASGEVLRASSATAAAFDQLQHSDLGGVGANDHHNQSHELASTSALGADHTVSGLTAGMVLKATGAAAARFIALAFSEITGAITDAQHGALTTSSSHSMAGDVSGTTAAAVVDKIKGLAVTAPVAGDDGQFLRYNHATGYTWETPVDSAGSDGSDHALFDHSDTAGTPATGDVIYRNGSNQWVNLAIGATGRFLRVVAGIPAWATAAFTDITGAITDAQHGALSASSSHTMGGDVTGTTAAAVVAKIQGFAVPAPTSAENEQGLTYHHGTTAFVYRTRIVEYTLWRRTDISTVGAGGEMPMFDGVNTMVRMPAAGRIVGLSVTASGDVGGVGDDYTVTVYAASSTGSGLAATAATATITGGASTERGASSLAFSESFGSGALLTCFDAETGTLAAVASIATIFVVFDV